MKKLLMLCILSLLAAFPLVAAEKKEVSLRFIQNDNIMRIVLESDDNSIKNASVIATLSSIKIEFPDLIELKKPLNFVFETALKDRFLLITLKNVEDVRSYRLSSPARLVVDLRMSQKNSNNLKTQTEAKPKQEAMKAPEKPVAAQVIFLDAGHGGYDYGIMSRDTKEKDLNLSITKDLNSALSKKGNKTFLTRKIDQSLSILERVTLVNSKKPDVFISMHSSSSNSFAVYTAAFDESATDASARSYSLADIQSRHREKSWSLAKAIGTALKIEFKGDVFIRELPLPVLSSIDSAAILIEYPSIQMNAYDQKMRDRLANAVVKGIQSHE
jgi:N-acetylmuramoyl-L-alanine amidase